MPKLPRNMVAKPPAFDNPLRRTIPTDDEMPAIAETAAPAAPIDEPDIRGVGNEHGGVVLPFASSVRTESRPDPLTTRVEASTTEINHRITVRIDDATRCALEAESHRRRIAGQKTNVAEIARAILAQWTSRSG